MERNNNGKKKSRSLKKSITIIAIIIYAIVSPFIALKILQINLNTETPVVVVVSDSMSPRINTGDLLFIHGSDAEDIENGSIIFFKAQWFGGPTEYKIHRVIDKQEIEGVWYFFTKGDAKLYQDPAPVREDDVFGVMVGEIPNIGYLKIILIDYGILYLIIILIFIITIISIARDSNRKHRQQKVKTYSKESKFNKIPRYTNSSRPPPERFPQPAVRTYTPLQSQSPDMISPPQIYSQPRVRDPPPSPGYGRSAPTPPQNNPPPTSISPAPKKYFAPHSAPPPFRNTQQRERTPAPLQHRDSRTQSQPIHSYSKQQNYRNNLQPTPRKPTYSSTHSQPSSTPNVKYNSQFNPNPSVTSNQYYSKSYLNQEPKNNNSSYQENSSYSREVSNPQKRQCPKCGARGFDIKEVPDKTRVISYAPIKMYAKKHVCNKCRLEF